MPDNHRSQSAAERDCAIELAGVAAKLEALKESVDALTVKVGEQNGRVGALERDRAAQQVKSVDRSQDEIALDEWRAGVDRNIQSLRESRAGMKSSITTAVAFVSCIGTLLVLGMMVWQNSVAGDQARRQAPAAQHQAK